MIQIITTLALALYSSFDDKFGEFCRSEFTLIIATIVIIATLCPLYCSKDIRMSVPANYILLLMFTLGESLLVANLTSYFEPESVIAAIIVFSVATFSLWSISLCIKSMDHFWPGMIISILIAMILQTLTLSFYLTSNFDAGYVVDGIAGTIVYSVYVIIDLKIILEKVDIDDYILGAITLYLDLIQLFIKILQILGKRKK